MDPVVNVNAAAGPVWWATALVAIGSAAAGGVLTILGQRIDANRRAKNEALIRTVEHRRDDIRQWDERIVGLAAGIMSSLSNMRMTAIRFRQATTSVNSNEESRKVKERLEQELEDSSSRKDNLLAELRLIAPSLYPAAREFCEKSDEIFFGVWEDATGEGNFAMVDWRSTSEIPEMIDAFATAVNATLRLPALPWPTGGELGTGGGVV